MELAQLVAPAAGHRLEPGPTVGEIGQSTLEPARLGLTALDGGPEGPELTPDLGRLTAGNRNAVAPLGLEMGSVGRQTTFGLGQALVFGRELAGLVLDDVQIATTSNGLGLEVGDDGAVGKSGTLPLDPALPLGDHRGQSAGSLAQRLEPDQRVAQIVATVIGQLALVAAHLGGKPLECGFRRRLVLGSFVAGRTQLAQRLSQLGDLTSRHMDS